MFKCGTCGWNNFSHFSCTFYWWNSVSRCLTCMLQVWKVISHISSHCYMLQEIINSISLYLNNFSEIFKSVYYRMLFTFLQIESKVMMLVIRFEISGFWSFNSQRNLLFEGINLKTSVFKRFSREKHIWSINLNWMNHKYIIGLWIEIFNSRVAICILGKYK